MKKCRKAYTFLMLVSKYLRITFAKKSVFWYNRLVV